MTKDSVSTLRREVRTTLGSMSRELSAYLHCESPNPPAKDILAALMIHCAKQMTLYVASVKDIPCSVEMCLADLAIDLEWTAKDLKGDTTEPIGKHQAKANERKPR